jgi:HK97 gp10 family phage protein
MTKGFQNMDKLQMKMKRLEKNMRDNIANILLDAANTVKSEAQKLIQTKSSGTEQVRYRNGKKRIVTAAAEGQPPNTDTGKLVRSIKARKTGQKEASVGIFGQDAPYGKYLEYGTNKMGERPWLRPALKNKKRVIDEKLKGTKTKRELFTGITK